MYPWPWHTSLATSGFAEDSGEPDRHRAQGEAPCYHRRSFHVRCERSQLFITSGQHLIFHVWVWHTPKDLQSEAPGLGGGRATEVDAMAASEVPLPRELQPAAKRDALGQHCLFLTPLLALLLQAVLLLFRTSAARVRLSKPGGHQDECTTASFRNPTTAHRAERQSGRG